MPSLFAHGLSAIALGHLFRGKKMTMGFCLLSMFCAIVPDADVIAFKFGIPYRDMFGHRGFTHSIGFSILLGALVSFLFYAKVGLWTLKWWAYVAYFSLVTLSHALLDAMTNGGLGVALFAPFTAERYFLPWRPIQVSPISIEQFFGEWGMRVIASELFWIGIPSLVVIVLVRLFLAGRNNG